MAKGDVKKTVISKWAKAASTGERLQQVVYKTEIGTRKGKVKYSSKTKHERIS